MPHRKLVKIGESPKLPTIHEFFTDMAARQRDEIRRLKAEFAGQPLQGELNPHPPDSRNPVPDPWLLHPVRVRRASAAKPLKKKTTKEKAAAAASSKKKTTKKKAAAAGSGRKKTGKKKVSGKKRLGKAGGARRRK